MNRSFIARMDPFLEKTQCASERSLGLIFTEASKNKKAPIRHRWSGYVITQGVKHKDFGQACLACDKSSLKIWQRKG